MQKKHKIIFLYTEIATYFLSCVDELIKSGEADVYLFRWPLNKEAPFDFKFNSELKVLDRKKYDKKALLSTIEEINPDLIYCSGWVDQGYRKVSKKYKNKIPVIVGIDNHWVGSNRQKLAVLLSKFAVRKYFNKAWVPGEPQKYFAKKLGFKDADILTGFYSADVDFFNSYYNRFKDEKRIKFPHRFIYVGRYLSFKGIYEMWNAFIELQNENPSDWELWCLGTGAEFDKRIEHQKIKHFGFIQPDEIQNFIKDSGVFMLPSTFEPWGVVVHEFAASGFPMIVSDKVGAASVFVQNEKNGFIFDSGNKDKLKECFKKMMSFTDEELFKMGETSHLLAQQITPKKWADKLISILK